MPYSVYIRLVYLLTHWGQVTHIWVNEFTIIHSDYGLLPGRPQAIIWTNAWILLIRTLGTHCSEIVIRNETFAFKKMHLKISSAKWRSFCLSLNVLSIIKKLYTLNNIGSWWWISGEVIINRLKLNYMYSKCLKFCPFVKDLKNTNEIYVQ